MCRSPAGRALTFHRLAAVGPPVAPFSAPSLPQPLPTLALQRGLARPCAPQLSGFFGRRAACSRQRDVSESVRAEQAADSSGCSGVCCSVIADCVTAAPRSRGHSPTTEAPEGQACSGVGALGSLAPGNHRWLGMPGLARGPSTSSLHALGHTPWAVPAF